MFYFSWLREDCCLYFVALSSLLWNLLNVIKADSGGYASFLMVKEGLFSVFCRIFFISLFSNISIVCGMVATQHILKIYDTKRHKPQETERGTCRVG